MSLAHFQAIIGATGGGANGNVVVVGGASEHTDLGNVIHAGIAFSPHGKIDDIGPGIGDRTQLGAVGSQWWDEEPDTNIGLYFDVRCSSVASGSWDVQPASVGTWIQMSVERAWRVTRTAMVAPGTTQCSCTFQVGPTGEATSDDSGSFSGSATN